MSTVTLTIDADVIEAAKLIAIEQNKSLDEFVTSLIRQSLGPTPHGVVRNGVPLIKNTATGRKITLEFVNELRDEYP